MWLAVTKPWWDVVKILLANKADFSFLRNLDWIPNAPKELNGKIIEAINA